MDLEQLRTIFRLCDVAWVFDEGAEERSRQILRGMGEVDQVFAATFGRPLDPPLEQAIAADVDRFKPLVQAFASPMTAPIRTMIYCVLDGAQIRAVHYDYVYRQTSQLRVSIEFDSGEKATFESDEIWDAEAKALRPDEDGRKAGHRRLLRIQKGRVNSSIAGACCIPLITASDASHLAAMHLSGGVTSRS